MINQDIARYNIMEVINCKNDLKDFYKKYHNQKALYKDCFSLTLKDHFQTFKEIQELLFNYNNNIGNNALNDSLKNDLIEYEYLLEMNSSKKELDKILWCTLIDTMSDLKLIYQLYINNEVKDEEGFFYKDHFQ